jgi:DHA2 family multidrug resistance protein-like MFS transporter
MLSIIYGIKQIAQDGFGLLSAASIIVGIALATAFIARQRRLTDPLIDLRLFKVPAFSTSICTQLIALMAMSGVFLFIAQYMQLVLGLSPLEAGLWMLPWTVGGMSASMLTPWIARRIRPAYVIGAGLILSGLGMLVLTGAGAGAGLDVLVTSFLLIATGLNLTMTMTTDLIMGVAPADRAGAASAISETSCELGLALGTAILGSVGIAWYRRVMAGDVLSGIPADAAAAARSTLGGAVDVGETLGGQVGELLLATSRSAFGKSLAVMAVISAVMMMTTAIAAVVALRRVPRNRSVESEDLSVAA